jgi:uncharacterized membrane protein
MSVSFGISKHHMDALVDGVFAIAMTLLVLEVKVPELDDPADGAALLAALGRNGPVLLAYFLSFGLLGVFWVWHHRLSSKVRDIDGALLLCTLVFLALVCFFPFAAALLGRYINHTPVAMVVYFPVLGLILLCQLAYLALAMRRGLVLPDVAEAEVRSAHRRNILALAWFMFCSSTWALAFGIPASLCCLAGWAALMVYARRWRAPRVPA